MAGNGRWNIFTLCFLKGVCSFSCDSIRFPRPFWVFSSSWSFLGNRGSQRWNEISEFRSQRKGRKEEGRRQGGALLRLGFWSKNARFKKRSFQTAADLLAKKCSFLLGLIIGPAFFLFLRWREAEAFLEVIVPPFSLFLSPSFLPLSAVIMREKGGRGATKKYTAVDSPKRKT